jgi:hypothetical protein
MSAGGTLKALVSGDSPVGREATVDIIRGLCIVSMVFAHVAKEGYGFKLTHYLIWYDGAMGFVLLSGLIVGIVQRNTIQRGTLRDGQLKALRRARLVYVAHLALVVLSLLVAVALPLGGVLYASVDDMGGWWQTLVASLLLQVNPPRAAILSLYVVLLLITVIASFLAVRKLWIIFGVGVIGLFALGHLFPVVFTLQRSPGAFGEINWATWQALYFIAFAIGWNWKTIRPRLDTWTVWAVAAVTTVGIVVFARSLPAEKPEVIDWLFGSGQMGVGTVILAFAFIAASFPIVGWLGRKVPDVTGVLSRVGRRSLDCYIILCVLVLVVPSVIDYDRGSIAAELGAVAVLAVMWAWCRVRDLRSAQRALRAPAPSPVAA